MRNDIWTNTRLKTYQACPMKERFRYRDCLVPIGRRDALNIGTAVHRGIETWSVEEALKALEFSFPSSTEDAEAQEVISSTSAEASSKRGWRRGGFRRRASIRNPCPI